jgi:hypothetical protein
MSEKEHEFIWTAKSYTFNHTPTWVGNYQIGGPMGLKIFVLKRPRWLTRFLLRVLLEWEWEDAK